MSDPITIPVKTNLYLWLLTGRSGDFFNAALNTGIIYSVSDTPPEVIEMREMLNLEARTSDFYALAALAAARMSTSFIRTLPHENDAVFANGLLALPAISSSHALLPPDSQSWPSIDGGRAGQDGFTHLTFTALASGKASITTSTGGSDLTSYDLALEDGGATYRLSFDKAEEYGIKAHFQVASWTTGAELAVNFTQTRYPFKAVADAIGRSGSAKRLMNAEGTIQAYSETSNAARKVGMAALAVIRRMLRYINENQTGFKITTTFDLDGAEPLQQLYEIDPVFSAVLDDAEVNDEEPVGFDA